MGRIEIDRAGYAKSLESKNKSWIVYELVQNAFDEPSVTKVLVVIDWIPSSREIRVLVEDDAPQGFRRLSDAYTMWSQSLKVDNPGQAGRFNEGDKKIILCANRAKVYTTTGTVSFEGDERIKSNKKTASGSVIDAFFSGTKSDYDDMIAGANLIIQPMNITFAVNGVEMTRRRSIYYGDWSLPTVIGADLRPTRRTAVVNIYEPRDCETAMLYECGIPIVETGDRYHINISQKIPLNRDRDNVTPAFLKQVRALALNSIHDQLSPDDFTKPWVSQAVTSKEIATPAIAGYLDAKYGKDRVSYDPKNPESVSHAQAAGFTVISGRSEAAETWEKIREAGLVKPAGQAFPPTIEEMGQDIPLSEYTPEMRATVEWAKEVGRLLLDKNIQVGICNTPGNRIRACYGQDRMTFNLANLGKAWFRGCCVEVNDLIIHELGHDFEENHLSDKYYRALTKLGAKLAEAAMLYPETFRHYSIP